MTRSNSPPQKPPLPWYAHGLRFSCLQSGHCCSGGPGYVWITHAEIQRLAHHLQLPFNHVIENYCRLIGDQYSLNEDPNAYGGYDCVFLVELPAPPDAPPDQVAHPCRSCTIYPARPLQCRTWPFWQGNLISKSNWDRAAARCPGINQGRLHSADEINALRDAADWPLNPPSSNPKEPKRSP